MRFKIPQNDIDESERLHKEYEQTLAEKPKVEARIDKLNTEYLLAAEELRVARIISLNDYVRTPAAFDRTDKAAKRFAELEGRRDRIKEEWEDRRDYILSQKEKLNSPYFLKARDELENELQAQLPAPYYKKIRERTEFKDREYITMDENGNTRKEPYEHEVRIYVVETNVHLIHQYKEIIKRYLSGINSCKTLGQLQMYMDQKDEDLSQNNLFSGKGEVVELTSSDFNQVKEICTPVLTLPTEVGVWPKTPREYDLFNKARRGENIQNIK